VIEITISDNMLIFSVALIFEAFGWVPGTLDAFRGRDDSV
jgi:hypothetical protein